MKILLATSEALPFAKSGGLGDFIYSYSKTLAKKGHDVSVVMPLYKVIRDKHPEVMNDHYDTFDFNMGGRMQGCGCFRQKVEGVNFYFLAMDRFDRDELYGYGDDDERFACFQMGVNTFVTRHNEYDVVHCNDWQTGVIPLLLKYNPRPIKTIITIHNPAFQGWTAREHVGNWFNLDSFWYDNGTVRMGDCFNYLKTGIMTADRITTVSKTHRNELMNDSLGFGGIGNVIRMRENDFVGIVNGLDTDIWDPTTDPHLAKNYSIYDYKIGKRINRDAILEILGMDNSFRGPLFSAITRLSGQKGVDRIISAMDEMKRCDGRLIVIGTGDMENEVLMNALNHPEVYLVRRYDENLAHLLYAASDYFLMPSYFEPCGTSQMISMRYGTVPIVSNVGGLADTVIDLGAGNNGTGFVFNNSDPSAFMNCLISASQHYYQPGIDHLIRNGMKGDYGWNRNADEFVNLYNSIVK